MTFEQVLEELTDSALRLTSRQLTNLADLEGPALRDFAAAWPQIEAGRRRRILIDLAVLAEDNIDLIFDAVFKVALEDEEAAVRAAAIRGLCEYVGRDVIHVLATLVRADPDAEVRRESAVALGRYAIDAESDGLDAEDAGLIQGVLVEAVEDLEEDETVRARAIEALGAISGEETQNLIESVYEEESIWLKIGAVDAMGRSCDEAWLPVVLREMDNAAPEMRFAAVSAAGSIGDDEAVAKLAQIARDDPDREVQLGAVRALAEIGGRYSRGALKNLIEEADDGLRQAIEEAIAEAELGDDPLGLVR
jgi:HEAT repeat protein